MRFVLEKEMCYTVNKTEESKEKKEGKENEDRSGHSFTHNRKRTCIQYDERDDPGGDRERTGRDGHHGTCAQNAGDLFRDLFSELYSHTEKKRPFLIDDGSGVEYYG